MPCVTVIVCERGGRWAAAIRRLLADQAVLRQTRGTLDLRQELARAPEAIVALELGGLGLSALLDELSHLDRSFPQAAAIVLGGDPWGRYRPVVIEAGAILCIDSPRRLAPLWDIVRRQQARLPPRDESLIERIWSSLPLTPT